MSNLTNIFEPIVKEARFHSQFRALLNSPYHVEARSLINSLCHRMGKQNKSFIRNFQADGFHSHLFEIACFAYLESAGLIIDRTFPAPDFLATRDGVSIALEATTANPQENQAADISILRLNGLSDEEIAYKANIEFPRRMISLLKKKLAHKYDKLPQCENRPLILMVAPFFEPGAVYYTDESLVNCLYEISDTTTGFFFLPSTESISAVLYCNAFTVPRFFRLATSLDAPHRIITATRTGMYYATEPDGTLSEREYHYSIGASGVPEETWHQGVTLFLNPNARFPIAKDFLPCTSSFSIQDDFLVREVYGFHPLTSYMEIHV